MAGHSQFKNIMYRKGAQDKRRAGVFARLTREITVAARSGPADPDSNPRLRAAIAAARAANMPKDNIQRALRRAPEGGEGSHCAEVRYEGYGPGGVAILVETLTDNRNRTAGELRALFSKGGGALAETNAVAHMFARVGLVRLPLAAASAEAVFAGAIEAGASDCAVRGESHEVECASGDLARVRDHLAARFGADSVSGALAWRARTVQPVADAETARSLLGLLEALEGNEGVRRVYANCDFPETLHGALALASSSPPPGAAR